MWTVFSDYDTSFVWVLSLTSFGLGFRRLLELGLFYFLKDKLNLEAMEITFWFGIMTLPQILKMFLAIFADCISCCGSKRKSYLLINTTINIVTMVLLMVYAVKLGKYFIVFCMLTNQVVMTWCDAINDALVAQVSRQDSRGASNLNSWWSIGFALGGIIACATAGTIEYVEY